MLRVALAVMLLSACSFPSMSTRKVGTFGYLEPPAIAIRGTGSNELLDVWRTGVERAPVRVAGELGRVPNIIGHPPPTPTELCGAAASLGTPVAEIVVVGISMGSRPIMECVKTHCWTEDPIGQGSSSEPHCACVKEEYRATESGVGGTMQIIDRAKCRVRAERQFGVSARASGDNSTDEERSRKAALDKLPLATATAVASLFPHGFGFDQLDDRVELTHDRDAALTEGKDLFVIAAQRQPTLSPIVAVPHVVVSHADATTATLVASSAVPTIKAGDELHARVVGHRWSLYPMIEIGRAESHALVGISAAGRWSSPEIPLVAEASVCTDAIPGLDTVRKFVGLMAGVRWWPGGPINPITFVDGGLAVSTQSEATSQGRYIGYGAGVELWLGKVFVFADVRRRSWSGDPFLRDAKPVDVAHPDTSFDTTTAQLTVGHRL